MKTKSFSNRVRKTLIFYNVFFIIIAVIFIRAIPKLLVYPPDSINTEFERHIDDGFLFDEQCFGVVILALIASDALLLLELKRVKGWEKYINHIPNNEEEHKKLEKIKYQCCTIPSKLYFLHAFVPPIATSFFLMITRCKINIIFKNIYCGIYDMYYHWFISVCTF